MNATIAVHLPDACEACADGHKLDHKATGEKAAIWRKAVNVSQQCLARNGLNKSPSYYSALETGRRYWSRELIQKFEAAIVPLMEKRNIDPGTL